MTTQDNAISTIVDGAVNAFILEISANYPELANVMGVVASAATVYGFAKIRSLFIELASKVEGMRKANVPMEYLSSPQFVDEISQLLYEKSIEDLEQRRKWYANYFESCCRRSSVEKQNMQRYLNLLKDINLLELAILKSLPSNKATIMTITRIYNKCVPAFNEISQEDVTMGVESLESKGLIKQISSKEVEKLLKRLGNIASRREQMCYYKTTLGVNLLQFIG